MGDVPPSARTRERLGVRSRGQVQRLLSGVTRMLTISLAAPHCRLLAPNRPGVPCDRRAGEPCSACLFSIGFGLRPVFYHPEGQHFFAVDRLPTLLITPACRGTHERHQP